MQASFTNTQMQVDTLAGTNTRMCVPRRLCQDGAHAAKRQTCSSANGETEVGWGWGHIGQQWGGRVSRWGSEGMIGGWKWERKQQNGTEKGRTEMSDKKMKGTSSEPLSGSESNASSYYNSSVHRQQRVPGQCLKTKTGVSLLLCASAAQTWSSLHPNVLAQNWATQSRRNTGLRALGKPRGTIVMCALVRFWTWSLPVGEWARTYGFPGVLHEQDKAFSRSAHAHF